MTNYFPSMEHIRRRVAWVNDAAAGAVCGELRMEVLSGDENRVEYLFLCHTTPVMRNVIHTLHGGSVALVADQAMGSVANSMFQEDGPVSKQWQLPFSQFVDLDRDYGNNAVAWLLPVITALELEPGENGGLAVKCGLAVQYVIYDRTVVRVVEDAYSPRRPVELQQQEMYLPARLDTQR